MAVAAARLAACAAIVSASLAGVNAQTAATANGRLRLERLDGLSAKAVETVEVEVDGILMKFASSLLSDKDPEERNVKEIIAGLKGVYVRSFETKSGAQFTDSDLAPLREQLRAPGWSRVVSVKSRAGEDDDAEIYVATEGGRVEGMVIITSEPKALTVINIVGAIDVDKLKKLEGTLGIPRIHVERKGRADKKP